MNPTAALDKLYAEKPPTREALKSARGYAVFSGQADANAETSTQGAGAEASVTVVPGTSIYQITKAGLALQATLQGTKFWADKDLN